MILSVFISGYKNLSFRVCLRLILKTLSVRVYFNVLVRGGGNRVRLRRSRNNRNRKKRKKRESKFFLARFFR